MDVVLAGADSLWVLRRARSDAALGLARGVPAPAKTRAAELAAIADALPEGFRPLGSKAPLDLTYFSRRQRPSSAKAVPSSQQTPAPDKAVAVASSMIRRSPATTFSPRQGTSSPHT